jgi:hypothetical protein
VKRNCQSFIHRNLRLLKLCFAILKPVFGEPARSHHY